MNAPAKEYDGIHKYIRITDIDEQTSAYKQDDVVSPDAELEEKYKVKENDILFARTGASTGKSYLYDINDGVLYYAGFLIRGNVKIDNNAKFVFLQTKTSNYKNWVGIMSARSGQPGINSQEYSSYRFRIPSKAEQNKIAQVFSLIDDRIQTQIGAIEAIESLITGITSKISRSNNVKQVYLKDLLTERTERNVDHHEVYSVSVSEGVVNQVEYLGRSFAAADTSHYCVARYGDIIYTKSPTGSFPYGIVKRSDISEPVAVSPLYGVYRPLNDNIGIYLHQYFCSAINAHNYLHKLIQKGAKNTINITNQRFLQNTIPIPDEVTLEKYVRVIDALVQKLKNEKFLLESYRQQKVYLLKNMFV